MGKILASSALHSYVVASETVGIRGRCEVKDVSTLSRLRRRIEVRSLEHVTICHAPGDGPKCQAMSGRPCSQHASARLSDRHSVPLTICSNKHPTLRSTEQNMRKHCMRTPQAIFVTGQS